jgi:hypothetical protein
LKTVYILDALPHYPEKRAQAHFVIETHKGLDHAFKQVEDVVKALHKRRLSGENGAHA